MEGYSLPLTGVLCFTRSGKSDIGPPALWWHSTNSFAALHQTIGGTPPESPGPRHAPVATSETLIAERQHIFTRHFETHWTIYSPFWLKRQ